jgi:DNA polymerase-1
LLIETVDDELEAVKELLRENMEAAIDLIVPLKVDMNVGRNWYDTK